MKQQTEDENECIDVSISVPWGHVAGRWYGNRNVRPILALHGWLDNMGTWNNLIPLLPKHIGILCIDLPGHGKSSKYPNGIVYHAIHYVYVIFQVMRAYDWNKVSILSHSMSSRISFLFAALHPQKLDLLISIDVVCSNYYTPNTQIEIFRKSFDKFLIEDDRLQNQTLSEPPSYSCEQLEKVLYEGSSRSVAIENTKHILERNITKSQLYPDKYYFSRDGRIKHYLEFTTSPLFAAELANRIRDVPFCVIKGSKSNFINESSAEVIRILRANNPHFEFHEVEGTHHVHLNCAADVASILSPFINRHRPPLLNSWTVDEEDSKGNGKTTINGKMMSNIKTVQRHWFKRKCKL